MNSILYISHYVAFFFDQWQEPAIGEAHHIGRRYFLPFVTIYYFCQFIMFVKIFLFIDGKPIRKTFLFFLSILVQVSFKFLRS